MFQYSSHLETTPMLSMQPLQEHTIFLQSTYITLFPILPKTLKYVLYSKDIKESDTIGEFLGS